MGVGPKGKAAIHVEWNVDMEVQLFYAMRGHKPVGVNRHFQMACIHEKFKNSIQKEINTQQIWDHLESMYDMAALHESEIVPFPNEEADFSLPENEFKDISKRDDDGKVPLKGKDSSGDEDNSTIRENKQTPGDSKIVTIPKPRERMKETREEMDSAENSPKRKRNTRQSQEHTSRLASPAVSSVNTPSGTKRRRT